MGAGSAPSGVPLPAGPSEVGNMWTFPLGDLWLGPRVRPRPEPAWSRGPRLQSQQTVLLRLHLPVCVVDLHPPGLPWGDGEQRWGTKGTPPRSFIPILLQAQALHVLPVPREGNQRHRRQRVQRGVRAPDHPASRSAPSAWSLSRSPGQFWALGILFVGRGPPKMEGL